MSDSFADLWNAAAPRKQSNSTHLTIAERAALAEKERLKPPQNLPKHQPSVPSAWDGLDTLAKTSFASPQVDDDDDWGLGDFASASAPPPKPSSSGTLWDLDLQQTDDILGDLSRPVEDLQKERIQRAATNQSRPSPSRTSSPPPHILGQLVEMGFSVHQARTALASTDSGHDIQAALEILISNRESPSTTAHTSDDEQSRHSHESQPQPRIRRDRQIALQKQAERSLSQEHQSGLQAEKIFTQASEIGLNLFNRANAAWKEGKERVQKAYEDKMAAMSEDGLDSRRGSGRSTPASTRPKWMQEDVPAPARRKSLENRAKEVDLFSDSSRTTSTRPKWMQEDVPAPTKPKSPENRAKEVDLFSDSPTGVYVSKFRHAKPKLSTPPPSLPHPHPITTISAPTSAITLSQQSKATGAEFFKLGDFPAAEIAYTRAIEALPSGHALLILLYNNRALVRLKVGDVNGVVTDTGLVEELIGGAASLRDEIKRGNGGKIKASGSEDEINLGDALVKAWKRRAEALEGREKWEEAGKDWEKVAGAEWAGQAVRGEGARGAARCRKMQRPGTEQPKPKPTGKPARPSPRRGPTPPSQALNSLRAANQEAESEDLQRHALKDSVEARLQAWKGGKETNIRALLASLDTILWPELGVQKVGMSELISEGKLKIKYMKAIAKVHPDKLNTGNSTVEQRMIAGGVFGALNEAWNAFKS
ncbi:hypothetical protein GYMLUDRAFT_34250 [Collybiopsis luxurians FD-317 M1]|nr:hypothetical protein GYMLUDRAFT_34250 [Collybiopsis luxurians FD-317 M1]